MDKAKRHNIYVVELDKKVLEDRNFTEANPDYNPAKPCAYVGITGLTPEKRFANHKAGIKANKYVKRYGIRLRPRLFSKYNPMTYEDAQKMEADLASRLRRKGYGVWQK